MATISFRRPRPRKAARYRILRFSFALVLAAGCSALGGMFGREYFLGARMHAANDDLERQIHAYHVQRQRVERDLAAVKTPAGIERAARKLGWTKQGEVRIRIAGE